MRKVAVVCVAAALLALPGIAVGKKVPHGGQIRGDAEARVTLKATEKGGEVVRIGAFRARRVPADCDGGETRFKVIARASVPVNGRGRFRLRLRRPDDSVLRIAGRLQNGGRNVVGTIRTTEFEVAGVSCRIPKQRFVTRHLARPGA